LALWQAEFIAARLRAIDASLDVRLLGMTTKGDRWLAASLSEVGGKGLFVKELEQAIAKGAADIAVHSCKDLPAELPPGFELIATGYREEVRDALVSPTYDSVANLPQGARVGTSSLRRGAQLLARRADLQLLPVRGNLGTRLAKLDAGEYDAIILAATGLQRLALGDRIAEYLSIDDSLPAAGQGALSVECSNALDPGLRALFEQLDDPLVAACVRAERAVSAGLGADCSMPLAAHASLQGDRLSLRALLGRPDGTQILRAAAAGPLSTAAEIGGKAATQLIDQGGRALLDELPSQSGSQTGSPAD
jgi:hydroxymethylbilane synthase